MVDVFSISSNSVGAPTSFISMVSPFEEDCVISCMCVCVCVRVCANHVCLGALVVANMGQESAVPVLSHHDRHILLQLYNRGRVNVHACLGQDL